MTLKIQEKEVIQLNNVKRLIITINIVIIVDNINYYQFKSLYKSEV